MQIRAEELRKRGFMLQKNLREANSGARRGGRAERQSLIGMRKKGYEVPHISFYGGTDRKQRKREKDVTCNNCTQLELKHGR